MSQNTHMAIFGTPTTHPMSSQTSKIIQVYNARGMERRFRFISAKNTFDGNAQKIAPFFKVNVGERRVFKLYFFL